MVDGGDLSSSYQMLSTKCQSISLTFSVKVVKTTALLYLANKCREGGSAANFDVKQFVAYLYANVKQLVAYRYASGQ